MRKVNLLTTSAGIFACACLPFAGELAFWAFRDPVAWVRPEHLIAALLAALVLALAGMAPGRRDSIKAAAVAFGLAGFLVFQVAVYQGLLNSMQPASARAKILWGIPAVLMGALLAAVAGWLFWRLLRNRSRLLAWMPLPVVLLLAGGYFLPAFGQESKPGGRRSDRPDVVLVILDTTRADHLSVYGYPRPTTPSLERFSREARVYERAWSPAPWTPPAHASILTGLLPAQHGCDPAPLSTPSPLLPELLRRVGYATQGVVNNPMLVESRGWSRGFDFYRGTWTPPRFSVSFFHWMTRILDPDWKWRGDSVRALRWVRRWWRWNPSGPRFVMLNLLDPHSPYGDRMRDTFLDDATRSVRDLSHDSEDYDSGRVRADGPALRRLIALYDADLLAMDQALGEFFDWLRERGELDSTLFVITADHGERLGERGLVGHQLGLDEALLRVPLIVRYPPSVKPGRVSRPVQTHGIFATVIDVISGKDLNHSGPQAPALDRQESPVVVAQAREQDWYLRMVQSRGLSFDPTPYRGDWSSVGDGAWKLVRSTSGASRLYKLGEDPEESQDVSADHPEIVQRLSAFLDELPPFAPATEPLGIPAEVREELRSLGYIQ